MKDFIETSVGSSSAADKIDRFNYLETNEANVEKITVLDVMNATSSNDAVAKLVKIWENKNAQRAVRGAALSTMALSLAACGGSSDPAPADPAPEEPVVDPANDINVSANMIAANPAIVSDGTTNVNDSLVVRPDVLDDVTSITGPYAMLRILHDGVDATLANGLAISNVTTVSIEDINGVNTTIDASEWTGLTNIKLEDVTAVNVTLNDIQDITDIIHLIDVVGAGTVTIDYDNDAVSGTADAMTAKLQEMQQGLTIDAGIETITLDVLAESTATASNIAGLTSTGATTLNITGGTADVAFTITGALEDGLTLVNAASSVSDLTLNVGTDGRAELTVTLGEGDDTLVTADTLDEDTISGGLGDDTVTAVFDNPGTRTPDMDGVETLDVTFDDSATVDFRNVDDVTTVEVRESTARIALENMDNTVTAINVYELQAANHQIEYASGQDGTLTLTWNVTAVDDAAVGTLSFDELLTLDMVFTGDEDVTGTTIGFDDADTEEVTIRNTGDGDVTFTTFGATSSAVTDLTLSTADSGNLTLTTFAEADALENLTLTASYGDLQIDAVGGGTAAGDLDEWTTTARNDGNVTYAGAVAATGATLSFLQATAEDDSTITYAAITAQDIDIIDVSVEEDATVNFGGVVTATEVTEIDADGEGTFTFNAANNIATIDEIDVSGMGDNATSTVVVGLTTSDMTIRSGEGTHTFTLGQGESTIILIAGDGADSFIQNGTVAGTQVFTNFQTTDAIDLSVVGIEGNNYVAGAEDLVAIGDMTTVAAAEAVLIVNLAGATDLDTVADTANVIHVDGNYANVAAMVDELENGGDYQLTFDGAMTAATDVFLVLWDDGTNSYLSAVETANDIADNGIAAAGDFTGNNLITFNGIADADDITAAMLGTAFIA